MYSVLQTEVSLKRSPREEDEEQSSPSDPRCAAAAAAAGRTWPSPATAPVGTSTYWRTSSSRAASWARALGRPSSRGPTPWGTSGCTSTRTPACRSAAAAQEEEEEEGEDAAAAVGGAVSGSPPDSSEILPQGGREEREVHPHGDTSAWDSMMFSHQSSHAQGAAQHVHGLRGSAW